MVRRALHKKRSVGFSPREISCAWAKVHATVWVPFEFLCKAGSAGRAVSKSERFVQFRTPGGAKPRTIGATPHHWKIRGVFSIVRGARDPRTIGGQPRMIELKMTMSAPRRASFQPRTKHA